MARSDTSIANRAIDIVGGLTITSLNDNSKAARALKRAYTPVLEDLLFKHNWSFAIARAELSVAGSGPLYEYDTAFNLPLDYVRLIEIYPKYLKHKREGDKILADAASLKIKYIRQVTNPNEFTPEFAELFAKALAAQVCYKITQSRALEADKKQEFKEYYMWATSNDSKQAGTPEKFADDVWMAARGYGNDTDENAIVDENFNYGSVS